MEHLLKNSWTEEDHTDFYKNLKTLEKEKQATLVLMQAARLAKVADPKDQDMLKAAESLVNFWILKYSNAAEKGQADYLLNNIHQSLNEM